MALVDKCFFIVQGHGQSSKILNTDKLLGVKRVELKSGKPEAKGQ